jgi:uncharacterized protein YceK
MCPKYVEMKKIILLIIIFIMIQGCATIRTLNPASNHVEIAHKKYKSYCKKIPRIYSGSFSLLCKLYGEPNYEESASAAKDNFTTIFIDGLFSFGLDTAVLPYTVTRQYRNGSISVN